MNITHIIGNGFDINQGIPTSYAHFYEYYLQLVSKDDEPEIVKKFRINLYNALLESRSELWSDMEIALGKVTEEYDSAEDYNTVYMDVYNRLMEYIDYAYRFSDVANFDNPTKTLYQDLMKPWLHLTPSEIEDFDKLFVRVNDNRVKILSFNYTDTFNRISDLGKLAEGGVLGLGSSMTYHFDGILHIHQDIKNRNIVLGVDNVGQIANKKLAEDESVRDLLVKPQTNSNLGTTIDRQCREVIAQSGIISIYGVSLGKTDQTWWNEIGKRIKADNNVRILYFTYEKEIAQLAEIQKHTLKRKRKRELMAAIGIDEKSYRDYENRIYVNFCNNPGSQNIFNNSKKENLQDNFENVMAVFQKEGKVAVPAPKRQSLSGLDSLLLQPPVERLFTPRHYRAKNLLIDNNKDPLGIK